MKVYKTLDSIPLGTSSDQQALRRPTQGDQSESEPEEDGADVGQVDAVVESEARVADNATPDDSHEPFGKGGTDELKSLRTKMQQLFICCCIDIWA